MHVPFSVPEHACPLSFSHSRALDARQFLGQHRHAKVARLDALGDADLEDLHDLLHRGPCFEGALDVTAHAPGPYMCVKEASKAMLISSTSLAGRTPLM